MADSNQGLLKVAEKLLFFPFLHQNQRRKTKNSLLRAQFSISRV